MNINIYSLFIGLAFFALWGLFFQRSRASDTPGVALWRWDFLKKRSFFSEEFCRLLGVERQFMESTLDAWLKRVHPDDVARVLRESSDCFEGKIEGCEISYRMRHFDGSYRWLMARGHIIKKRSRLSAYVCTFFDITHFRETEIRLQGEIAQLVNSNQELSAFAYSACHDLQEPLRTISWQLQLLRKSIAPHVLSEEQLSLIDAAVASSGRSRALISNTLIFAKAGREDLRRELCSVHSLVDMAVKNLEESVLEAGAHIECANLPLIFVDQAQYLRVFQNLIGNAIHYRRNEAPRIVISASRLGRHWCFSIEDNGVGLDEANFEDIFRLFSRVDAQSNNSGHGIGLAIAKKIVERHGGRIWVKSKMGVGSTFYFTVSTELPLQIRKLAA